MERSAAGDDAVTCPDCETRDGLTIKWLPDIDSHVHERTEVGCKLCNKWFVFKEDRWAFAHWNSFATRRWKEKGIEVEHAELHELLLADAVIEEKMAIARKETRHAIDEYLSRNIEPTCPLRIGDRFLVNQHPRGYWSVQKITVVYGWNTGPFWIINGREVLNSGKLGNNYHEFWQRDVEKFAQLKPFWKAWRWTHLVKGDACIYGESSGEILEVNRMPNNAILLVDGTEIRITTLSGLFVPTKRIE